MRGGNRQYGKRGPADGTPGAAELPDRAWRVFDVVNAKIEHADVKAGAVLGACGIAAAGVVGLLTSQGKPNVPLAVFAVTTGILVLTAAAFSCAALWPRRLRKSPPDSLLYFDHIARRPASIPASYEDDLRALLADPEALSREIIKQVSSTSHVASRKYDFVDRSMICLFGSLITLAATAVIFAVQYRGH